MNQSDKAKHFASLHQAGNPITLFNVWDVASSKAVESAGGKAIATGSWAVAGAHGYDDGEQIPLPFVEDNTKRICEMTNLPVTIDFEGAYAESPREVAANVERIVLAGAVGINFEDRIVDGQGLYDVELQCARIMAIRSMAKGLGVPLFINARTDLFLQAASPDHHGDLIDEAKARAQAYANAGASGYFVPGLISGELIREICAHVRQPINIVVMDGVPENRRLAELGVSRISYGRGPFLGANEQLQQQAAKVLQA